MENSSIDSDLQHLGHPLVLLGLKSRNGAPTVAKGPLKPVWICTRRIDVTDPRSPLVGCRGAGVARSVPVTCEAGRYFCPPAQSFGFTRSEGGRPPSRLSPALVSFFDSMDFLDACTLVMIFIFIVRGVSHLGRSCLYSGHMKLLPVVIRR